MPARLGQFYVAHPIRSILHSAFLLATSSCAASGSKTVCSKLRFRPDFVIVMKRSFSNSRAKSKRPIAFRKHLSAFTLLSATATFVFPVEAASASHKASEVEAKATVTPTPTPTPGDKSTPAPHFKPESSNTSGSVTVEGNHVDYQAVAGTIVVHPKGWDDAAPAEDKKTKENEEAESQDDKEESKNPTAEASMFYVAYTKQNMEPDKRRSRLLDRLAAHGRFWTPAGDHSG
jgi:hypothetical protein